MKKKIFIAGGSGLVGYNLFQELEKKNYIVKSSYNKKKIKKKNFKFCNFENFDDCLRATRNIDILYILAVKGSGILNVLEYLLLNRYDKSLANSKCCF